MILRKLFVTSRWREIAYFVPRRVLRSKATKDLSRDIRMLCERSFLTAFVRTRRWRFRASAVLLVFLLISPIVQLTAIKVCP